MELQNHSHNSTPPNTTETIRALCAALIRYQRWQAHKLELREQQKLTRMLKRTRRQAA